MRWFLLGLAVGALAAVGLLEDGHARMHDLREWSARTLRSLEHRPVSAATVVVPVVARPEPTRDKAGSDAPCPVDPGPDDPCAELLAPFRSKPVAALDIPGVPIESLPRVRPPIIARHRHAGKTHGPPAAAVAEAPDPPVDMDADPADDPPPLESRPGDEILAREDGP